MVPFPIFKENLIKKHQKLTHNSYPKFTHFGWVATVLPNVLGSTVASQYLILIKKFYLSLLSLWLSPSHVPHFTRPPSFPNKNAMAEPAEPTEPAPLLALYQQPPRATDFVGATARQPFSLLVTA